MGLPVKRFARLAGALVVATLTLGAGEIEKPPTEYAEAMRRLAAVVDALPGRIAADDRDGLNQLVIDARPAIAVVERYWTGRDVAEAVGHAQAASKAIAEISVAAHLMENGPNPLAREGAEESLKTLRASCVACHSVYRETLADGTFAIR